MATPTDLKNFSGENLADFWHKTSKELYSRCARFETDGDSETVAAVVAAMERLPESHRRKVLYVGREHTDLYVLLSPNCCLLAAEEIATCFLRAWSGHPHSPTWEVRIQKLRFEKDKSDCLPPAFSSEPVQGLGFSRRYKEAEAIVWKNYESPFHPANNGDDFTEDSNATPVTQANAR